MTSHLEVPEWRDAEPDPEVSVYISGPMRGRPSFGFPVFDRARDWLTRQGYRVFSPADNDRATYPGIETWPGFAEGRLHDGYTFDLHEAMSWDLATVAKVDAIVLLPGWERSSGARHELYVAEVCGKRQYVFEPGRLFDTMSERVKPQVVAFSGYARAGKDTAAEPLIRRGWERVSFADALKAVLYDLNPLVAGDTAVSEWVDHGGWEWSKGNVPVRDLLQRLGVAVREHVDPDAWVNAALRQVKPGGRYVITDLRFPNEYDAVKRLGGKVYRIERPGYGPVNGHISETALDSHDFDATIPNDGTIADLHARIEKLATTG